MKGAPQTTQFLVLPSQTRSAMSAGSIGMTAFRANRHRNCFDWICGHRCESTSSSSMHVPSERQLQHSFRTIDDPSDIGFSQFSLLPLYSLVIPTRFSDPGVSVTHKQASFASFSCFTIALPVAFLLPAERSSITDRLCATDGRSSCISSSRSAYTIFPIGNTPFS